MRVIINSFRIRWRHKKVGWHIDIFSVQNLYSTITAECTTKGYSKENCSDGLCSKTCFKAHKIRDQTYWLFCCLIVWIKNNVTRKKKKKNICLLNHWQSAMKHIKTARRLLRRTALLSRCIYRYMDFYSAMSRALRHGSHSFTGKLHHACLDSPAAEHHCPLAVTHFTVLRRVEGCVHTGGWLHTETKLPPTGVKPRQGHTSLY